MGGGRGRKMNTTHNISKIATSLFQFATAAIPDPVFKRYLFSLCLNVPAGSISEDGEGAMYQVTYTLYY